MSAEAVADPLILDVVELPEPSGECPLWVGDADDAPEACGQPATHVFVYDGKIGGDETLPKNCRACPNCAPEADA